MKSVTASQIKKIDRRAVDDFSIPTLILMENAGRSVADLAERVIPECFKRESRSSPSLLARKAGGPTKAFGDDTRRRAKILIVCGKGNNGGDGFAAARHLFNRGHKVSVVLLGKPSELKGDAKTNFQILKKMRVSINIIHDRRGEVVSPRAGKPGPYKRLNMLIQNLDLIIDAIFGTGLDREVVGLAREVISILNEAGRKILSIDIPSGMNGDSGEVMGIAVQATVTGTLAAPKTSMMSKAARKFTGKIEVLDISIPRKLLS